jgi:hypothetical protein
VKIKEEREIKGKKKVVDTKLKVSKPLMSLKDGEVAEMI